MHPYLPHLLSDLGALIEQPPPGPYVEVPPHLEEMPWVAELAQAPFTTLEEITGIALEALPPFFEFTMDELALLADAFRRLFDALNMAVVDLPEEYPDDAWVDQVICHWNEPIQYLPQAGCDLEWCSGDNDTCPYGEDCLYCGPDASDPEDEKMPVPFVGGLFNDDGTRLAPLKVPIPELCLRCKSYLSDDWEDNILCTLTRNDQKDDDEFECGAFEEGEESNGP